MSGDQGEPIPLGLGAALRAHITRKLTGFDRKPIEAEGLRRAAVAVVVTGASQAGEAAVLLTFRSDKLRRHSGQYALPGGRMDEGETEVDTALRELEEELRITLPPEAVLGFLDDYQTRSGFRITPVVVWGGEIGAIEHDPVEVAEVHRIPLAELLSPSIPTLLPSVDPGRQVLCAHFPVLGHEVYAPTAALLYQFREVALAGRATRVAHFDQPEFAWR
jgi:8-oxo-dGTP pyrophosphatase MutT (NUDIX family)